MKLNSSGSHHAAALIAAGKIKDSTSWEAPGAGAENQYIAAHGMAAYGMWHLGVNPEAADDAKGRYGFPFTSDFRDVDLRGLAAAEQRASQAGYADIAERARELFEQAKAKLGKGGRGGIGTPMDTLHTGQMGLRRPMTCIVRDAMDGGGPCMDFIASDEATDRYGEAIDQNGWQLEHFRRNPVIADSHDYSSVSRILGRAVRVEVREGRLHNRVEFCTANPLGNLAYRMARGGFIRSQSVGFIPLEWEEGLGQDEPKRTYTRAELLEISLVAIPANPGATIGMALKNGAVTRRDLGELYEFLSRSGVASAPTGSIFPAEQQPSDERWYGLARQLKPLIERP